MDFSIIIPHKNIPLLLQRCLDSIPEVENIEVIIVDDNSDPKIVDFAHYPGIGRKNTKIIYTKEGKGAGYARNVGMENATGKWILFADADDFYVADMHNIISAYKDTDADAVFFKMDSFDEETKKQSDRHINRNASIDAYLDGSVTALVASTWQLAVAGQMYRKEFIQKKGICFDEIVVCNDSMFACKVGCLAHSVQFCNHVLYIVSARQYGLHASKDKDANRAILRQRINVQTEKMMREHGINKVQSCNLKFCISMKKLYGAEAFKASIKMTMEEKALFYGLGAYILRKLKH